MEGTLTREELLHLRGDGPPPQYGPPTNGNGAHLEEPAPPDDEADAALSTNVDTATPSCAVCKGPLPAGKRRFCSDKCANVDKYRKNKARRDASPQRPPAPKPAAPATPSIAAVVAELLDAIPGAAIDITLDGAQLTIRRP